MKINLVLIGGLAFTLAFSSMQYAAKNEYMEKTKLQYITMGCKTCRNWR